MRRPVSLLRAFQLSLIVLVFPLRKRFSNKLWLFNLDCHISVIADLEMGLREFPNVRLVSWNLSRHNWVFRRIFTSPDPVRGVNAASWKNLEEEDRQDFHRVYGRFLSCFDGFITTYPLSFLELVAQYGKPVLSVVATRYENPYTQEPERWKELDELVVSSEKTGQLLLCCNNEGDSAYVEHHLSIAPKVVPSVCDYVGSASLSQGDKVVFAKSNLLAETLASGLGTDWRTREQLFGSRYSWKAFRSLDAVFYVPYNVSTMTLFELATLGIPVFVPDSAFIKRLAASHQGVMTELSFGAPDKSNQVSRAHFEAGVPASLSLDWWLERADFYDQRLMPNVVKVGSLDEVEHQLRSRRSNHGFDLVSTQRRNNELRGRRRQLLEAFLGRVGNDAGDGGPSGRSGGGRSHG